MEAPKPKPQSLPKNSKPVSQFTLEELKKTAASRGISVEKLIAQMVQNYLQEGKKAEK
jgi:hypothetical protein